MIDERKGFPISEYEYAVIDELAELFSTVKIGPYKIEKIYKFPVASSKNLKAKNRCPRISTIERVCKITGISIVEFFRRVEKRIINE